MIIKSVEINNFRLYEGLNKIELAPSGDRNVVIVSGKNGFGKTTFLMAMVWCLYGKQTVGVDNLYSKEIGGINGYSKYIRKSMNFAAEKAGETSFWVEITFAGVGINPLEGEDSSMKAEVSIRRSFNIATGAGDKVEIRVNGKKDELIETLKTEKLEGEEVFIREFILPLEVAKFFFFDAEKIVSLAEVNSDDERRKLSKAYSEVLGIKKYEDLKKNLETIREGYKKKSATKEEHRELSDLENQIKHREIDLESNKDEIQDLETKIWKEEQNEEDYTRMIVREDNSMTEEEFEKIKQEEKSLIAQIEQVHARLSDFLDLIPYGIAGKFLNDLKGASGGGSFC